MDREKRLIKLYNGVYSRPGLARALDVAGKAATVLVALSFLYAVLLLVYTGDYLGAVRLSVLAGIPFVIVSLMREINQQRRRIYTTLERVSSTNGAGKLGQLRAKKCRQIIL